MHVTADGKTVRPTYRASGTIVIEDWMCGSTFSGVFARASESFETSLSGELREAAVVLAAGLAACVLLTFVAVVASYLPVWRAASVNPAIALRRT